MSATDYDLGAISREMTTEIQDKATEHRHEAENKLDSLMGIFTASTGQEVPGDVRAGLTKLIGVVAENSFTHGAIVGVEACTASVERVASERQTETA